MRTYEEQVENLYAFHTQIGGPPGALPIAEVATMLVLRDELIRDLKRVIESGVREQRQQRRAMRIAERAMR